MSLFPRRSVGAAFAAAALAVLASSSCRRDRPVEIPSFRFTDALTAAGIIASPLRPAGGAMPGERSFPVQSVLMSEIGRGEDPLGIKRRVNLGLIDIQILFAPPRSEFEYRLPIRAAGRLDFGVGIIRDANSVAAAEGAAERASGVNFLIILESRGRKRVLFEQRLEMPPARESRTVNYAWHTLDLPEREDEAVIRLLTAGGAGAFSFWHAPAFVAPEPRVPNIILISIDTLRPDHLGAYGYKKPVSPRMDALAAESVLFKNVYSTASWTLPGHMSMLTGLNGVRHRVLYEDDKLDPAVATLADYLRSRGYATRAVTGAGFVSAGFGFAHGFDEYAMNQAEMEDADLAAQAAREAVAWIEKSGGRPFFLFLHTYQVHSPYKSPDEIHDLFAAHNARWRDFDLVRDMGGRPGIFTALSTEDRNNLVALYDAGIRTTDRDLIEPLLDVLRRRGLYDRTMIVLTSDHGEEFYEHGGWNHTHSLYDELIKVPLIIKMPWGAHAGRRLDPIVRLTDLVPTILEVAGVGYDPASLDGRTLMPLLEGRESADRPFQAEFPDNVVEVNIPQRVALSEGRLKLVLNQPFTPKHIAFFSPDPRIPDPVELFDLAADPGEQRNLAGDPAWAATVRELVRRAQEVGRLIPKREGGRSKVDPELERQLRALGYIR